MPNSWWANKLAQQGQPRRPSFPQPPMGPGQPQYQQAPPGYQPPPPPPQPQQQQEWQPNTVDPTKMSEVLPIWHWQGNPRGGAGETATTGDCPACGSPRFFSRSNGGGQFNSNTGVTYYPKPECADCGYPNEQGSLGAGAAATGAAMAARQGVAPPPPGSIPLK